MKNPKSIEMTKKILNNLQYIVKANVLLKSMTSIEEYF